MSHERFEDIQKCLDVLLSKPDLVLSFDKSSIDQLPEILSENFNVCAASQADKVPALARLFELLLPNQRDRWEIEKLPQLLEVAGIKKSAYIPVAPRAEISELEQVYSHWTKATVADNKDAVVTLQRDLGMGQYNPTSKRHEAHWEELGNPLRHYLIGVTTVPPNLIERILRRSYWQLRIAWWKFIGYLDETAPSLSIGPRWVTEIEFFRKIVGLKQHIGLDLFSDDENLVRAGDMHRMPFPDRYFQFIFIKNTTDKSYDIRKLVAELLRVTRSGGIIVVDQICGYGDCTPLTRTDIQKTENLLRLFRRHCDVQVLVQTDINLTKLRGAVIHGHSNNNARLAIRVPMGK